MTTSVSNVIETRRASSSRLEWSELPMQKGLVVYKLATESHFEVSGNTNPFIDSREAQGFCTRAGVEEYRNHGRIPTREIRPAALLREDREEDFHSLLLPEQELALSLLLNPKGGDLPPYFDEAPYDRFADNQLKAQLLVMRMAGSPILVNGSGRLTPCGLELKLLRGSMRQWVHDPSSFLDYARKVHCRVNTDGKHVEIHIWPDPSSLDDLLNYANTLKSEDREATYADLAQALLNRLYDDYKASLNI